MDTHTEDYLEQNPQYDIIALLIKDMNMSRILRRKTDDEEYTREKSKTRRSQVMRNTMISRFIRMKL